MTLLLQSRLLDVIRQELGGTYSITATPDADRFPKPQYSVRIEWTCDPARVPALVARVFEEIEFVKNSYISREGAARVRDTLLREHQDNSLENGYLLNQITRHYFEGLAPGASPLGDLPAVIGALTGPAIQEAARRYLANDYVKVVLMPGKPGL
jgi:predicted Zn-dependent peptidase